MLVLPRYMRATSGSSRVMCDNVPGLVSHQRQLCHRHPDVMRAIGLGVTEWTMECQHQFRQHRWNCNTLDRDHSLFGRVLLRSKSLAFTQLVGSVLTHTHPCLVFTVPACLVLHSVQSRSLFCWVPLALFYWAQEACLKFWRRLVMGQDAVSLGSVCPCSIITLPVPLGSVVVSRRKGSSSHRALLTFKLFFLEPDPSRRI